MTAGIRPAQLRDGGDRDRSAAKTHQAAQFRRRGAGRGQPQGVKTAVAETFDRPRAA